MLFRLLFWVSNDTPCTCFYSFCLFDKCIFQWRQGPVEFCFSPLALAGLLAGIPGFHPGYPGSIPGQGSKISLQVTTHCCVSEIRPSFMWQRKRLRPTRQKELVWTPKAKRQRSVPCFLENTTKAIQLKYGLTKSVLYVPCRHVCQWAKQLKGIFLK